MVSALNLLYRSPRPLVNASFIVINILVFLYQVILSDVGEFQFTYRFGLIPWELTSGGSVERLAGIDVESPVPVWGTAFSYMFVHGGPLHIMGNMLFLWGFGDKVELKLGHIKYLFFYLGAGVVAAWAQIAIDTDSRIPMIGASGAVFGVLGAYLLAYPYDRAIPLMFVFFLMPLIFGIGSFGPANPGAAIAYMAHVGGFVAGVLFMASYKYVLKEPILPRRSGRPLEY